MESETIVLKHSLELSIGECDQLRVELFEIKLKWNEEKENIFGEKFDEVLHCWNLEDKIQELREQLNKKQ